MGPRSLARTAGALLVVAAVAGSGAPSAAALRSDASLIRDCARDGRLDARYGADQLRHALTQLPGDVDEYTNCRDVITAALLASPGERSGARGPRDGSGPSNASAGGADGRRSAVVAPSDSVVADSGNAAPAPAAVRAAPVAGSASWAPRALAAAVLVIAATLAAVWRYRWRTRGDNGK